MAKWTTYPKQPPFDGRYLVRAQGSTVADECAVVDGKVIDVDGDEVLNINCEWQRLGA